MRGGPSWAVESQGMLCGNRAAGEYEMIVNDEWLFAGGVGTSR